jgi:hypothetical protein
VSLGKKAVGVLRIVHRLATSHQALLFVEAAAKARSVQTERRQLAGYPLARARVRERRMLSTGRTFSMAARNASDN